MEYLPMSLMQYIQKMKRLRLQIPKTTIKATLKNIVFQLDKFKNLEKSHFSYFEVLFHLRVFF